MFDDDRYFDVFVEYAKEGPEDILIRITVYNRGPETARLRLLPTLWFRNTWSWERDNQKPLLRAACAECHSGLASRVGRVLACIATAARSFCSRKTRRMRSVSGASRMLPPYVKDAFHSLRHRHEKWSSESRTGRDQSRGPLRARSTSRRQQNGTSTAHGLCELAMPSPVSNRYSKSESLTRTNSTTGLLPTHLMKISAGFIARRWPECCGANSFTTSIWRRWLIEHKSHPLLDSNGPDARNTEWFHMLNADVISMPDKWEYPWYAAWDLAFHTLPLALVDFDFAKEQLLLMLRSLYFHPNGQIPAYEWNFSDVNPPVHAWATLFLYKMERALGRSDLRFLERSFQGLMLNFNWWVNRKDPSGRNVFAGGFLGLDNIGVFDRSAPTSHRRIAGAGRWNRMDGVLLPVHAGNGSDSDATTTRCTKRSLSNSSSISCLDRLRHGPHRRASGRDVGRRGRLLLRRLAAAGRAGHASEGSVHGGTAAAVRVHIVRG